MPPLLAVTHSSLIRLPEHRDRFLRCARLLLDAGAQLNGHPLSALYGAAGLNHDPEMTQLLLAAGADPNDNESLYHSTESLDPTCTRLLLEAGARVEGSNAVNHVLDRDDLPALKLLLQYVKDFNALTSANGDPLAWALRRRRSRAHIEALIKAGSNVNTQVVHGISAYRYALLIGLPDVAQLLAEAGAQTEPLSIEDEFVAACASAHETEARRILGAHPGLIGKLSDVYLRQLPQLMEARALDAVKLMVELGWPIATPGGDWSASALNLAVFQGDAEMTRFLLAHGASWTERHGFNDNVRGTLSWASRNNPGPVSNYAACAEALFAHGMPNDSTPA